MATSTKTRKVATLATISETMRANLIESPAPEVAIESPAPEVAIESPAPEVAIESPAPEVAIESPAPEATVESPAPEATVESPAPEATVESPALYKMDGEHIAVKGVTVGYLSSTDVLSVVSAKGKITDRHTALGHAFAPKTVQVAIAYEKTRKLCLNGRYKEFFADVSRLMSTQDKTVLFNHPSALSAFSSEPNKAGALALLRFCIGRWSGVKNAERVAFAALCKEILAALTK